jgi:hypothetical protein
MNADPNSCCTETYILVGPHAQRQNSNIPKRLLGKFRE